MFHAFSYQLHVRHQLNLTGLLNRDRCKLAASAEAPAGCTERAPAGTIGKATQQRSELLGRRVEICTLLCRVLIRAGLVTTLTASSTTGVAKYPALSL